MYRQMIVRMRAQSGWICTSCRSEYADLLRQERIARLKPYSTTSIGRKDRSRSSVDALARRTPATWNSGHQRARYSQAADSQIAKGQGSQAKDSDSLPEESARNKPRRKRTKHTYIGSKSRPLRFIERRLDRRVSKKRSISLLNWYSPDISKQRTVIKVPTRQDIANEYVRRRKLAGVSEAISKPRRRLSRNRIRKPTGQGDLGRSIAETGHESIASFSKRRAAAKPKLPLLRREIINKLRGLEHLKNLNLKLSEPDTPSNEFSHIFVNQPKREQNNGKTGIWQAYKGEYEKRKSQRDASIYGKGSTTSESSIQKRIWYKEHLDKVKAKQGIRLSEEKPWWINKQNMSMTADEAFGFSLALLRDYTLPQEKESTEDTNYKRRHTFSTRKGDENRIGHTAQRLGLHELVENVARRWSRELSKQNSEDTGEAGFTGIKLLSSSEIVIELADKKHPPLKELGLQENVQLIRNQYAGSLALHNLNEVFKTRVTRLPAPPDELQQLILRIALYTISQQDRRFVLPEKYKSGEQFQKDVILGLLTFHERSGSLNTEIMNIAIKFFLQINDIKAARDLIGYMEYLQIPPNYLTYYRCLSAAAKAHDFHAFLFILRNMLAKGIMPKRSAWQALLNCAYTVSQRLQILSTIKESSMKGETFLDSNRYIELIIEMWEEHVNAGRTEISPPWSLDFEGYALDIAGVNAILDVALKYDNVLEARNFFNHAVKRLRINPDTYTLSVWLKYHGKRRRIRSAVHTIRDFGKTYGISTAPEHMEMLFNTARLTKYYSVGRVVWAYACLENKVTKGMIDRMRTAIHEQNHDAGKFGKVVLGVDMSDIPELVQMPLWALRATSELVDSRAYLMTDGRSHSRHEMMKDLQNYDAQVAEAKSFNKKALKIRKELLRRDLVVHNFWKPVRPFTNDIMQAFWMDANFDKLRRYDTWSMLQLLKNTYTVKIEKKPPHPLANTPTPSTYQNRRLRSSRVRRRREGERKD